MEKSLLSGRLKILKIHCQNFALIITNRIIEVRQGADIFDKRSLNSCKLISEKRGFEWYGGVAGIGTL